jgi:hypothetical protein
MNILEPGLRKTIIDQINGNENKLRKNESLKRFDIYQKRQARYLSEQLKNEYSQATVAEMRRISSINLGPRIVDKQASLYVTSPERTFQTSSGRPLTENEQAQVEALYQFSMFDTAMKKANRYFKLESQCALQLIPRGGIIFPRVLLPHHYDVIPDPVNPELPFAYIISVYDRSLLYNQTYSNTGNASSNYLPQAESDQINQVIADPDDPQRKEGRYIWWTREFNFITDGSGNLIDELGQPLRILTLEDLQLITNPIQRLPFVDIASSKEFEFWVRQGNDIVDFALDFSVLLSDTAEINKRQGYSQAIVYSEEPPKDMLIGPNRVLHMKLDPNKEVQPKFEWATPTPDMQSALKLLETYLALFLTSQGMDAKTVSATTDSVRYSSGFERLLAMIDEFEASADDMDLFRWVEQNALEIMVAWSNVLQGATVQGGVTPLRPELQSATLPEGMVVSVKYARPQSVKTDSDIQDEELKKLDAGLTTRTRALMNIEGISEEEAQKRIEEIDAEGLSGKAPKGPVQGLA